MLDEILFWNKLRPTSSNMIFFFFFETFQISRKPFQHFIQQGKNVMLDEMLDWFAPAFRQKMDIFDSYQLFPKTQMFF